MRMAFVMSEVAAGLRRNLTMTIAMILTTGISLGFFGAALLGANQISDMKELYYDKLEVSIYLKDDITPPQRQSVETELKASPEVQSYQFLTKEQAFERFKRLFRGNPQLVSNATPDDLPATFLVRMKDPERYTVLAQQFTGTAGIDQVQGQSEVLDRLFSTFSLVRNGAIVLAVLQAIAALLLISNTIQVAAFNRRVETGIMRLVGASRWYTQLPFMLEAALAGVAGAAIAVIGMFGLKYLLWDRALAEPVRSGIVPPLDVSTIIFPVAPAVGLVGIVLATVAAYVTLRLYVRL